MKRKSILVLTGGVLLVGIGLLVSFIINLNNNNNKNTIKNIKDTYSKFEEVMQIFTGEREVVTASVTNDLIIEQVEYKYSTWITTLDEYLKTINSVNEYKTFITKNCVDKTYKDSDATSKCQSMINNYETMINYYVKDINSFNSFINEYNTKTESTRYTYDLNEYNFIDINDDGKYLGK